MPTNKESNKWTVMAYLAGDNSLGEEMVYQLKEMRRVGSTDDVKVIAQFDLNGMGIATRRLIVEKGDKDGVLSQEAPPILNGLEVIETNTGAPKSLADFINFGINQAPYRRLMVVLSGHGSGADEDFLLPDQNPPDSLSLRELGNVFTGVTDTIQRKVDILGLDSCLMSMAEVCYEVRDTVQFLVGSEGFMPNTGWPFERVLRAMARLVKDPPKGEDGKALKDEELAAAIATAIVEKYILYYRDYVMADRSVDLSAIKLENFENDVVAKTKTLAKALKAGLSDPATQDAIILAHWRSQSYKFEQYTDLSDFCQLLQERVPVGSEIASACAEVTKAISDHVVRSCFSGPEFQHSNGLSVYFPWAEVSPHYHRIGFATKTGWDEFLEACVFETRRKPRLADGVSEELLDAVIEQTYSSSLQDLLDPPESRELSHKPVKKKVRKVPTINVRPPFDVYALPESRYKPMFGLYSDQAGEAASVYRWSMKNPATKWDPRRTCRGKS